MKTAFCSITTLSHLFKTKALWQSLSAVSETEFHVLLIDGEEKSKLGISYYDINCLKSPTAKAIINKYKGNALRWSCKPLFLLHLLEIGYDAVIYVDNDICFYSSPDFLFDKLKLSNIILTPHYYESNPQKNQNWLEANFRVGLYNAGFVGASRGGVEALNWWAECCLYNIKQSPCRGLFDDQKYLDLLPVLFDNISIIKNKGCNVAGWNLEHCARKVNEKNELLLDGKYHLVFIHFTSLTLKMIQKDFDPLLKPCLEKYLGLLRMENPNYDFNVDMKINLFDIKAYIAYLIWKLHRLFE